MAAVEHRSIRQDAEGFGMHKFMHAMLGLILLTSGHHAIAATPDCLNGLDCYTKALERLQSAQDQLANAVAMIVGLQTKLDKLERSKDQLPIGTIIAFDGNVSELDGLQKAGWWVADGRVVTDPDSRAFLNRKTPNLVGRFLVGSNTPELSSGNTRVHIDDQTITSYSVGGDWDKTGAHNVNGPASVVIHPEGWISGPGAMSRGVWHGGDVELPLPPNVSVIYLIKVK